MFFLSQCMKLKREDIWELFVKNVLNLQHDFAMLDLEKYDYN